MDLNLKGKSAVVCGSTQGLGFACASELALLGANVILFARNEASLKESLSRLDSSLNQQHSYLIADFSDPVEVKAVISNFAEDNISHILINNTGGPPGGSAMEATDAEFISAFNSHLICNQALVQALVPGMKKANFGRIINIISTSVKSPIPGLGVSNTIRGAVANWSKTLAGELGPFGITVNNALTGFTNTARASYIINKKSASSGKSADDVLKELVSEIPVGRMAEPAEFAAAVAFLCTPAASYINGINLPVDGGRLGCL